MATINIKNDSNKLLHHTGPITEAITNPDTPFNYFDKNFAKYGDILNTRLPLFTSRKHKEIFRRLRIKYEDFKNNYAKAEENSQKIQHATDFVVALTAERSNTNRDKDNSYLYNFIDYAIVDFGKLAKFIVANQETQIRELKQENAGLKADVAARDKQITELKESEKKLKADALEAIEATKSVREKLNQSEAEKVRLKTYEDTHKQLKPLFQKELQENERLKAELAQKTQENISLQASVDDKKIIETALKQAKEELSEAEKHNALIKEEIDNKESRVKEIQSRCDIFLSETAQETKKAQQAEAELAELKLKHNQLMEENNQQYGVLVSTQGRLENIESALVRLNELTKTHNKLITDHEEQCTTLTNTQAELDKVNQQIKELTASFETLQEKTKYSEAEQDKRIETLSKDLEEKSQLLTQLRQRLSEEQKKLTEQQDIAAKQEVTIEQTGIQRELQTKRIEGLQSSLESTQQEKQKLKEEVTTKNNKIEATQAEIASLERIIKESAEYKVIAQTVKSFKDAFDSGRITKEKFNDEIVFIFDSRNKTSKKSPILSFNPLTEQNSHEIRIEQLTHELLESAEDISRTHEQVEQLKLQQSKDEQTLSTLKEKVTSLEKQLDTLNEKNELFQTANVTLTETIATKDEKITQLEDQSRSFLQETISLQSKNATLNANIRKITAAFEFLANQFNRLVAMFFSPTEREKHKVDAKNPDALSRSLSQGIPQSEASATDNSSQPPSKDAQQRVIDTVNLVQTQPNSIKVNQHLGSSTAKNDDIISDQTAAKRSLTSNKTTFFAQESTSSQNTSHSNSAIPREKTTARIGYKYT